MYFQEVSIKKSRLRDPVWAFVLTMIRIFTAATAREKAQTEADHLEIIFTSMYILRPAIPCVKEVMITK